MDKNLASYMISVLMVMVGGQSRPDDQLVVDPCGRRHVISQRKIWRTLPMTLAEEQVVIAFAKTVAVCSDQKSSESMNVEERLR